MIFNVEKFKHASVDLELFAISTYQTKLHFNNYKVDCVMSLKAFYVKLSFLKVHFSVLTLFVVVHVTSHSKKLLYANFSNIVGRDNTIKIEYILFFCYDLISPIEFYTQNWYILINKLLKHLFGQILKINKFASLRIITLLCSFFVGKTPLKRLRHLAVKYKYI